VEVVIDAWMLCISIVGNSRVVVVVVVAVVDLFPFASIEG